MRIGILIVGSLLWDKDKGRPSWREERLYPDQSVGVAVPLRYGRRSQSRGNTYTMVISPRCEPGCGVLVPCKEAVETLDGVLAEAEALWRAEQPSAAAGSVAANWGRVALLPNVMNPEAAKLGQEWTEAVAGTSEYRASEYEAADGTASDDCGLLNLPWQRAFSEAGVDLLLATATKPHLEGKQYPTLDMIADAWVSCAERADYFWCNRANGIRTFQDPDIEARLAAAGLVPNPCIPTPPSL